MALFHEVMIIDKDGVVFKKVLKPRLTRLHLNDIIHEHQQQRTKRTQLRTEYAEEQAKQLTSSLTQLPFHRKLTCVTKYVIAPLLKPPHGLV